MSYGNQGITNEVVNALASGQRGADADGAANSAADAIGEKLFGSTAESEYRQDSAFEASTQPTTYGRRSKHPDGQDPFHGSNSVESEQYNEQA